MSEKDREKEEKKFNDQSIDISKTPRDIPPQEEVREPSLGVGSRYSVVGTIYHQTGGESPTSVVLQYTEKTELDEQPYQRKIKIGKEWTKVDLGWLESYGCSLIIVTNEEGRFSVTPSKEMREEVAKRVVEIGYKTGGEKANRTQWSPPIEIVPVFKVNPNASHFGVPIDPKRIYLRCPNGTAKILLTVYPR